jgi:hypothetical protein
MAGKILRPYLRWGIGAGHWLCDRRADGNLFGQARLFGDRHRFLEGDDRAFRERLPDQEALVAEMRTLSLKRVFPGILAWDSFFHLNHDDQRRMFPIFRAHAGPRAALMFTSGVAYGEAIGQLEGEPLYHASLDPTEYRQLLDSQGFDVVATVPEDQSCGGRTVWLAQLR